MVNVFGFRAKSHLEYVPLNCIPYLQHPAMLKLNAAIEVSELTESPCLDRPRTLRQRRRAELPRCRAFGAGLVDDVPRLRRIVRDHPTVLVRL